MKAKYILAAALCAVATIWQAGAQEKRIVLASQSTKFPNERPVWSDAQAQSWFDAHAPIIGINHPERPCEAMSYDDAVARAAQIGFNSVRIWPFGGSDYASSVEYWASMCDKNGMTLAPVFGFSHVPTSASDSISMMNQVKSIITRFRGDKRILFWDIWNEPAYTGTNCEPIMKWIRIIARWCREAGCTQPITSSILWDAATAGENQYTAYRRAAEAEMDLHNFHDYSMQAAHEGETQYIINRYKKVNKKPIICTEALRRPNGSGVAVSLRQFAKYKMGFYTWGLYSCDTNWDVVWNTSTWYAFEPMFHNLLFAGGDPVDERELSYIKNFKFQNGDEQVIPPAEETERWTKRRAWKWMNDSPVKGYIAASRSDALSFLSAHGSDGVYNCLAVKLNYNDYKNNSTSFYSNLSSLAKLANNAGMKLLPILISSDELSNSINNLRQYAYNVILKFYNDSRIEGWCVFQQTGAEPAGFRATFSDLFAYTRYAFPCQPMFAMPKISASQSADSTATDLANYLWQLSDVTAYSIDDQTDISATELQTIFSAYQRPLFCLSTPKVQDEFADYHVNFFTSTYLPTEVSAFAPRPLNLTEDGDTHQMPSWKAWAQCNHGPVKGLSYNSIAEAIIGISAQMGKNIYNSVEVRLNYATYRSSRETFMANFNALLDSAQKAGMTVIPTLLTDRYARLSQASLTAYVTDMIKTYNLDPRIAAWELYNCPAFSSGISASNMITFIPKLFAAAREASPQRPVFVTPAVKTSSFDADFDYIESLDHYNEWAGWNKLQYYNGNISLAHLCWRLSDIVSYSSEQQEPQLGWLNSVAYRYGRPVICSRWEASKSTTVDKILTVFNDCHTAWYADTPIDEGKAKAFTYKPVITNH